MRPACFILMVVLLAVYFVASFSQAFLNDQHVHCFKPHEYPLPTCVLGKLTIEAPLCGFSIAAEL